MYTSGSVRLRLHSIIYSCCSLFQLGAGRRLPLPAMPPKKGMAKKNEQKKPAAAPPTKKIYTKKWKTEFTGPLGGRWKLVRLSWNAITGEEEEVWERAS